MKFFQKGVRDQWHFVIGKAASDKEEFYQELEKELLPQVQALRLRTGYRYVGNFLSKKRMHYAKYGSYVSLTCAEPFGTDLKVSWYLYFTRADATHLGTGTMLGVMDVLGHVTGKTQDKVIAFASVGKDSAERATQAILAKREETQKQTSGKLGDA